MGRGLAAIMAVSTDSDSGVEEFRQVAVELISPNPRQPRAHFDDGTLADLAESMRARGVLQPVLVRPSDDGRFELIAGERRWRAAQLAGLETIPALVRARDDAESLELALIENMAREDLGPVEEARACAALVEELGLSHEEVGAARRPRPRRRLEPDPAARPARRGARAARRRRPQRRSWPRAAHRHRPRRTAPPCRAARPSEGWSVRELEAQARAANEQAPAPARRRAEVHPDQLEACATIGEAFTATLGADVRVIVGRGGGYRVEMAFASAEEALAMARADRPAVRAPRPLRVAALRSCAARRARTRGSGD